MFVADLEEKMTEHKKKRHKPFQEELEREGQELPLQGGWLCWSQT